MHACAVIFFLRLCVCVRARTHATFSLARPPPPTPPRHAPKYTHHVCCGTCGICYNINARARARGQYACWHTYTQCSANGLIKLARLAIIRPVRGWPWPIRSFDVCDPHVRIYALCVSVRLTSGTGCDPVRPLLLLLLRWQKRQMKYSKYHTEAAEAAAAAPAAAAPFNATAHNAV